MIKKLFACVFLISLCLATLAAETNVLTGYDGIFKGKTKVDPTFLADKSPEELSLLRNEIFAKYGREFKTQKVREHFKSKTWYRVVPGYNEKMLTPTDNENIAMIQSFEQPTMDAATLRRTVLVNIEYTDDLYTVVFTDAQTLLIQTEGGTYNEGENETYAWSPKGDWILCRKDLGNDYTQEILLRLDHNTRRILAMIVF